MIIKKLILKEGMDTSNDVFDDYVTLIHSNDNSVGKSTFLRLLFHSLGFKIPSTYGLDFDKVFSEMEVENNGKLFKITRSFNQLSIEDGNNKEIFQLPLEHKLFLLRFFNTENISIVNNILGLMYVDQEKGWTLLNRGTVIGINKFNIDELIAGLGNVNCDELFAKRKRIEFEISKLKALSKVQEIKEQLNNERGYISFDSEGEMLNKNICKQRVFVEQLKKKIRDIQDIIDDNKKFFNYIDKMKLMIINPSGGEPIRVTSQNLYGKNDNSDYLIARMNLLKIELDKESKKLASLIDKQKNYEMNENLINNLLDENENKEIILQKNINALDFDPQNIESLIYEYNSKLKSINNEIKDVLKYSSSIVNRVYLNVYKYCEKLGIYSKVSKSSDFLFTDKLKDYSGTVLHKLVMAFKIALHKEIEEQLKTTFPFVLDSPTGREVKFETAREIINLIHSELPKTQIILASIYEYDSNLKIEFNNKAIESRNNTSISI